jgi:spore coat polysaccharide biosynthesis protein SpsF
MITAIIQARMNSRRLPGKMLMELGGKCILQRVIEQAMACQVADVIVATTNLAADYSIVQMCEAWRVNVFAWDGPEEDVLGRMIWAAHAAGSPSHILRVCGDSPLLDVAAANALIEYAEETHTDYVGYKIGKRPAITIPNGYFGEVVSLAALESADREMADDNEDRQHVTAFLYKNPDEFGCAWLPVPAWYRAAKLKNAAIDTADDLERVREELRSCV